MPIPDRLNTFCEDTEFLVTQATPLWTNVLRFRPATGNTGAQLGAVNRHGGDNLFLAVRITDDFLALSNDGTITFDLGSSATEDMATPTIHLPGIAIPEADLTAGELVIAERLPVDPGVDWLEYVALRLTAANQDFTAGSITARLVTHLDDNQRTYASGRSYS